MIKIRSKKQIVEMCRDNRKKMTPAESILWDILRNRKLDSFKFLRQHKFIYDCSDRCYRFFILDFYCDERKLALEIDGPIHDTQQAYDEWRTSVLNEFGIRVLRIRNEETINIEAVKQKIRSALAAS